MPTSASVFRRAQCEALGGQVELADSVHDAFSRVQEIVAQDGRRFVHPYEGPLIARGTGTLGLEIVVQCATLQRHPDAIVVASGGGGLTAGIASAVRQLDPSIAVYAVEPYGADSLWRSLAAGSPQPIAQVRTIADSLGAPRAEPYSFMLNQAYIRDVVRVHDAEIVVAMRALLEHAKLAVEPAGAAALAAVCGPLASRLSGKTVVVLVCGANIGAEEFARLIA
jgi:threonine dehydratase